MYGPSMLQLKPTLKYSVYELVQVISNDEIIVTTQKSAIEMLKSKGCCVYNKENLLLAEDSNIYSKMTSSYILFNKLIQDLIKNYDNINDEFNINLDHYNITRLPRIGSGKHNIHFDQYESKYHEKLNEISQIYELENLLSIYHDKKCVLRETGISITHPVIDGVSGEGMEYHSDGSLGENTVLLSLFDIDPNQGGLKVFPGSHLDYDVINGTGHGNIKEKLIKYLPNEIIYHYRKFVPMIIDARTIHGVNNNISIDKWRWICWFIFDSY